MPFLSEDIVRFIPDTGRKMNLYWGEEVDILGYSAGRTQLRVIGRGKNPIVGSVKGKPPTQAKPPLQLMMIDVQQGDGLIMITPEGRKIFIDGGDNKLFARFAAARFPGTSATSPLDVDAMIITHGDADHFSGLNEIRKSETHPTQRKRLFIRPLRVFHNGLVKGPSKLKTEKIFGRTVKTRSGRAIIDLEEDLLGVSPSRFNTPFKRWVASLKHWSKRGSIQFNRLAFGNKREFNFLAKEDINVEVLGPIETRVTFRGKSKAALPLLHTPPKDDNISVGRFDPDKGSFSTSHTINGHSVALRITYGNVRFFLGGDINRESMNALNKKVTAKQLQSEILKVPHHGSADFDQGLLKKISPVISLISSGDESSRKEYIHPRATLLGTLGKISRNKVPLIFSTELAAFFELRGLSRTIEKGKKSKTYFGFERTNFGIIHVRTDGKRILVFTHSGKQGMNEAYRLNVSDKHVVSMAKSIKKR